MNVLFIIDGCTAEDRRVKEALRIAAGISPWGKVRPTICFSSGLGQAGDPEIRRYFTLLRDMQQLIGNVERITGMLDVLDRISEAKSLQKKASTVTADRIEFKDVTVVTPADVLLVEKLSFRHGF